MKKILKIVLSLLIGYALMPDAMAQVHTVLNSVPLSLKHFVEDTAAWNPGDTIMLESEGIYVEDSSIAIYQDVTIMGDPSLSTQPVIYFEENGFIVKDDTLGLTLKNFKADGNRENGEKANNLLSFEKFAGFVWDDFLIEDVEAYGFIGGVQLCAIQHAYYKSVKLNRVFFYDMNQTTKSWALYPYQNIIENLEITNSTFADIFGILHNVEPNAVANVQPPLEAVTKAQNILIYRNTFYDVAGDGGALVQLNDPNDGSVVLTMNSNIVSTVKDPVNSRPFLLGASAGTFSITENAFHNFRSARVNPSGGTYNLDYLSTLSNVTVSDTLTADPEFTKTDTIPYDFTLKPGGPYEEYGDPRWTGANGVRISPLTKSISVGDIVTLTANVFLDIPEPDETVTWSVLNGTGSATIGSTTGEFTAVSIGTVQAIATSNEDDTYADTLNITIQAPKVVNLITLIAKNTEGTVLNKITTKGGYLIVTATVLPVDAPDRSLTWSLNDETLGSLDSISPTSVQFNASASGVVTIKATANEGGVFGTIDITLENQRPVTSITVNGSEKLTVGGTSEYTALVEPSDADIDSVAWSSSNESVATVDETGLVTALAAGTTTITASATDNSFKKGTKALTVVPVLGVNPVDDLATLYPNPASDFINLDLVGKARVEIRNLSGQVILNSKVNGNSKIDLTGFESGLYILNITQGNDIQKIKFIKD